jgi:aldehyde dehydrogenase (NAD+)
MRMPETTFYAVDPSTQIAFAELPDTSDEQVAELVEDARRALSAEWQWQVEEVRRRTLAELSRAVEAQSGALAQLEARDAGIPIAQARADALRVAAMLAHQEQVRGVRYAAGDSTVREPWGVCALVLSWRRPLLTAGRLLTAALAAGNAVVLKPSELAAITTLRLAELAEGAGVPRGLVHVATGDARVGEALVAHAGVDHVTIAGSAEAAARVARSTPLHVEVQAPPVVIVLAGAAPFLPPLPSRVYAEQEGERERIAVALAALKTGPAIEDVDVGPLISPAALERALAAGGEPIHGLFVQPGIATAAVGPLVTVEPLGAQLPRAPVIHIHAGDPLRAQRLALRLRADTVFINGAGVPEPPFEAFARTKRITELS